MLTLEETRWSLKSYKILSVLNILPIEVDVKSGKIQRQSNRVRVFVWKILFGVGVLHYLYMFGRFLQSTVIEPEKYFRWDHFVMHFGSICSYGTFHFSSFRLFVKTQGENVIIFNQLFTERQSQRKLPNVGPKIFHPPALQKIQPKSGNRKKVSQSARESLEESQNQNQNEVIVIETQLEPESGSEIHPPPRPLLTWPPQYSLDELMTLALSPAATFSGFGVILFLAVDPSRPQLLFSVLPPEYQNVWSFSLLLVVETSCVATSFSTQNISTTCQLLFFGKCQSEFTRMSLQLRNLEQKIQNGVGDVRREIWGLRQISKEMKELVVFVELFNRCFPFCIFAFKLCSMSISIFCYFFVIRHNHNYPFLAIFMGYCALIMTLTYTIMYANAFSIPGKMEDLKNEFLLTAQKITAASENANVNSNGNTNRILWAEMKKEMKGIRGVGIKVGSFNTLERESTPNFFDFVLNNVVSLLVTFPW